MGTINIGIGHDDDLVVAQLVRVAFIHDAAAECRDHGANFVVFKGTGLTRLLDIENLSSQRQNCLVMGISSLLRRASCGVTLDDIDFADARILARAIRQLSRQRTDFKSALAPRGFACLLGRNPRLRSNHDLFNNGLGLIRIFHQETLQLRTEDIGNDLAYLAVAKLRLRLSLVLRIRMLDGDDCCQTFLAVVG